MLIKSRKTKWDGHEVGLGDTRDACRIFIWKHEGKNNMEDVDVDDRIIMKWI